MQWEVEDLSAEEEFYNEDETIIPGRNNDYHELAVGGLARVRARDIVVTSAINPFRGYSDGALWFDNADGSDVGPRGDALQPSASRRPAREGPGPRRRRADLLPRRPSRPRPPPACRPRPPPPRPPPRPRHCPARRRRSHPDPAPLRDLPALRRERVHPREALRGRRARARPLDLDAALGRARRGSRRTKPRSPRPGPSSTRWPSSPTSTTRCAATTRWPSSASTTWVGSRRCSRTTAPPPRARWRRSAPRPRRARGWTWRWRRDRCRWTDPSASRPTTRSSCCSPTACPTACPSTPRPAAARSRRSRPPPLGS